MIITCNEKQLEIIRRALELYGRIRMYQFDFVLEDFNFNRPTGIKLEHIPYDKTKEFERVGLLIVEEAFGKPIRRDVDGDVAFSMHRQIHKATSNHGDNCCTCNRSDMLAGEPAIIISK